MPGSHSQWFRSRVRRGVEELGKLPARWGVAGGWFSGHRNVYQGVVRARTGNHHVVQLKGGVPQAKYERRIKGQANAPALVLMADGRYKQGDLGFPQSSDGEIALLIGGITQAGTQHHDIHRPQRLAGDQVHDAPTDGRLLVVGGK